MSDLRTRALADTAALTERHPGFMRASLLSRSMPFLVAGGVIASLAAGFATLDVS